MSSQAIWLRHGHMNKPTSQRWRWTRLAFMVIVGCASQPHDTHPGAAKPAQEQAMTSRAYATVHGLQIHYTTHGIGAPVVLLHGGVGASEMFDPIVPLLAAHRQVIAVDLQGHGRTADVDRPLRFEAMADDVAGLITQLGLAQVDVVGYSLGGGVAARLAIQHAALVGKLVLISTAFQHDAWYPEVLAGMAQMGPDAGTFMARSPLATRYPDVQWGPLFGKLGDLLRRDYDWSSEVRAIRAQPLLVFADADAISPARIAEAFSLFGGGRHDAGLDGANRPAAQLAILPGYTHYNVMTSPALGPIVAAFLDGPAGGRP
jgi:pimeloyl-ACP methyl ester carboxylesterase